MPEDEALGDIYSDAEAERISKELKEYLVGFAKAHGREIGPETSSEEFGQTIEECLQEGAKTAPGRREILDGLHLPASLKEPWWVTTEAQYQAAREVESLAAEHLRPDAPDVDAAIRAFQNGCNAIPLARWHRIEASHPLLNLDMPTFERDLWNGRDYSVLEPGPAMESTLTVDGCWPSLKQRVRMRIERFERGRQPLTASAEREHGNRARFDRVAERYAKSFPGERLTQPMITARTRYELHKPDKSKSNTDLKAWLRDKPRSQDAAQSIEGALRHFEELCDKAEADDELS